MPFFVQKFYERRGLYILYAMLFVLDRHRLVHSFVKFYLFFTLSLIR